MNIKMSFGSYSREDDYLKNFRERFNEIKKTQVSSTGKQGLNSLDRIAEFRKKLESSFNTRSEQSSKLLADESFKSYSKETIPEMKPCPSPKRYQGFNSFCKSPSNGSSFIQKDKLEDIIPLETLTEAKNALTSAPEETIKDLPYLYTFTLTRLIISHVLSNPIEMETEYLFFSSSMKDPSVSPENAFLCNFYLASFREDGVEYKTVEHYFQSKKFDDVAVQMEIVNAETPKKAKSLGRKYPANLENWERVKIDVMKNALRLKFTQNEELKRKLLLTGRRHLAEYSKSDLFWGGSQPESRNILGSLLMSLRNELQA